MTNQNKIIALSISSASAIVVGLTIWRPALILRGHFSASHTAFTKLNDINASKILGSKTNHLSGIKEAFTNRTQRSSPSPTPTPTPQVAFADDFTTTENVEETGNINDTGDKNWWVSSGGWFNTGNGIGKTLQGNLPTLDKWRWLYALDNPDDTNNGYRPQNIFRLVQRGNWLNYAQEVYTKIDTVNLSGSANRAASNGLFLFNRYIDSNNVYYTGLRVDGAAVIKKKANDTYYTMAYGIAIPDGTYDRDKNPNLLPINTWIGLRSEIKTNTNQSVDINFYVDIGQTGNWKLVAHATDNNSSFGGAAISKAGHVGIRTDFMDAEFKSFKITSQ